MIKERLMGERRFQFNVDSIQSVTLNMQLLQEYFYEHQELYVKTISIDLCKEPKKKIFLN